MDVMVNQQRNKSGKPFKSFLIVPVCTSNSFLGHLAPMKSSEQGRSEND